MEMERIARWAFIAFVVIAIVMGLVIGYLAYNLDPTLIIWTDGLPWCSWS